MEQAVKTYKIPLVVYDFPLPQHQWAFDASVYAHYFRSKSSKLNDLERAFRLYIYGNQAQINKDNLRSFAEKFGQEHKLSLPFVVDPQGKLADAVRADKDKGTALGIQHTPTIYVVSNSRTGPPFVEVVDRQQLFSLIDEMQKEAK
ncbi:MAG TPA: thioredoxin domain-containing protein [Terriglobales bacterium]|nr:thioredoxin domain-containing protein [Terriglobales bacterium]